MSRKRNRSLAYGLAALLGLAAFYAGTRVFAPASHPITGRQIAGIATDAAWMDRASRDAEESPVRALSLIGIHEGEVVADVGAGSGYMTIRLARLVGPTGKVYANDIQANLLRLVAEKAQAAHLSNVEAVPGSETDARLPTGTIDLALLVDVYHEFHHPQEMLQSIRRALKPDGQLVLVEYRKEDPTIPIADTHRMSVAELRSEVAPEGFVFDRAIEDLPRQHIVFFRKSPP